MFAGLTTPNGAPLDSLINILFHELVETILPLHDDDARLQIADKCANRAVGLSTSGNIVLGTNSYVVSPLWDNWGWYCSMGQDFGIRSALRANFCVEYPSGLGLNARIQ
jgi:hypothetical protein